MKKLLALVLALVMTLSLCVTSNAAFADAADIEHDGAVEVMSALGVIVGKGENKFDPKGNVTRAEMAKMITMIMLGDVDVSAFVGTSTDLKDVAGHWAEGYIKYCYSQGVIAGKGNNLFDPNANVTAAEAAKMLLVGIGYNAKVQGYEGADWAINVARDAQLSKFYDELSVTSAQVLTRDQAAQMIYNAVLANTITKTPTLTVGTNEVSYNYRADGDPLLNKTFDAYEAVGVMDAAGVTYNAGTKKYTYASLGARFERKDNVNLGIATFTTTEDYTSMMGEEINVVYVVKNGKTTVLDVSTTGKTTVEISAASALEVDGAKLKINGTAYTIDGIAVTTALAAATDDDMLKFTDSDNGSELDTVIRTSYLGAKVSYVSATEIIAGGVSYKVADIVLNDTLAKDDYVAVITHPVANVPLKLVKLDKISGKVDGWKAAKILTNGTWYNYSNLEFANSTASKEVDFYAINGVVIADSSKVIDNSTLENVVMVIGVDTAAHNVVRYAKILKADGTKADVKVDETSTGAVDAATLAANGMGDLYQISETSYGTKFTVANANIGDYTYSGTATITESTTISTVAGCAIADDAVIYVLNSTGDDGKVITGKQLKTLHEGTSANNIAADSANGTFTGKVGGMDRVILAAVQAGHATFNVGNAASNYAVVVSDAYKVDDNYITYQIWNGTENVTVREKDTSAPVVSARVKLAVIKYSAIDDDAVIKDVAAYGGNNGAVMGLIGDEVSFDGVNMKKLTKDTIYLYYDSSATATDAIGLPGASKDVLQLATKVEGVAKENVKYVLDVNDVAFILIDAKNALKDATTYALTLSNTVTANAASATVKFTDSEGNVIASGDELAAGSIINVVVTGGTANDTIEVVFNPANTVCASAYTSGTDITVAANAAEAVVLTFVMQAAGTITVQDAT